MPRYDELPEAMGARSAWGLFGEDDSVGRLNLLTPDRVNAAASLVRKGRVFALDAPLDYFDHYGDRRPPRHRVFQPQPLESFKGTMTAYDDVLDNFYPQGSSQWDALAHVSADADMFFNGATHEDIRSGRRCTIDYWAQRGIAGRGILLDVERVFRERGQPYDPGSPITVTVKDLEDARELARLAVDEGDLLLIHFGYMEWYATRSQSQKAGMRPPYRNAGLEHSEEVVRWLWDSGACAVIADNPQVEESPFDYDKPYGSLHRVLIGLLGFALGEAFELRHLASDCEADGVYEFLFTSAPLHLRGGIGSPPNALAIK